mgnify:CR=1 FL=1
MGAYMLDVGYNCNGFEIGCSNCSYNKKFFMGFSVFDYRFEDHVSFMEDEDKTRFCEILTNHKVQSTKFDKPIYRCAECGVVEMQRYALVVYDDGSVLETRFDCPRCGDRMQIVNHVDDIISLTCPECRNGRIKITDAMLWD